jgi:indole-3-glycerol phosphate synthase
LSEVRSFSDAILNAKREGLLPLVADIKPVSPRDGDLVGRRDPSLLARELSQAGACALSVVTESEHFGGSVEMLRQVSRSVSLPVLRKDFFSNLRQIEESKEAGAAAVLLTLSTIPPPRVRQLYSKARELGMEAVVEVHTKDQLMWGLKLEPTIIGINNRDILALEKDEGDVSVTEALAPLVPASVLTISESSLKTSEEISRAIEAGADAVLIGTALLQSAEPGSRMRELIQNARIRG